MQDYFDFSYNGCVLLGRYTRTVNYYVIILILCHVVRIAHCAVSDNELGDVVNITVEVTPRLVSSKTLDDISASPNSEGTVSQDCTFIASPAHYPASRTQ